MRGGLNISGRLARLWAASCRLLNTPRAAGFTVIEVVIVLAVTGALFISAAIMIAGRQNQTAFEQAARQVQSQVQQAVNEVATGHYPNIGNIGCVAGAVPSLSSVSNGQGTNSGCIFLGKALQFGTDNSTPDKFTAYVIAGLQKSSSGTESRNLSEAMPMVVARSTMHQAANYPDTSIDEQLQSGLRVERMWYNDGGADVEIGAVAFVNGLAEYTGSVISGADNVNVVAIDNTALWTSKIAAVDAMNSDAGNRIATGTVNPLNGVFICFDGGTDDYGVVRIGGAGRELAVTVVTIDKGGGSCTYS